MTKADFPRNLFKSPGDIKIKEGLSYSTVLVEDERAFDVAIKEGFIDDYAKALNGATEEKKPFSSKKKVVDEDDF